MTIDMHRFALMWLVYSRNKSFRVGGNANLDLREINQKEAKICHIPPTKVQPERTNFSEIFGPTLKDVDIQAVVLHSYKSFTINLEP